ncbi:MAG: mechanosensitive ion channel family protein [Flavobacteriales bacterium]|nr:mechanosensitive ion channel family protein [Flavobacteriales bacterium]
MEEYQIKLVESVIALAGYFVSHRVAKRIIESAAITYSYPKPRVKVMMKIVNILFFLLFASFILFIWGVNQNELVYFITSLLTVVGIAFLAQWSILSNITASLVIFFNHPVKIGDTIIVVDKEFNIEGRVSDIGIFFLIVKDEHGDQITIPTNLFMQKMIKKKTN